MPTLMYPPPPRRRSEKAWGYEQFIAVESEYIAKLVVMQPGTEMHWHYHTVRHESMFCAMGACTVEVWDRPPLSLQSGQALSIHPGTLHRVRASREGVRLFEVSTPQPDDVARYESPPASFAQPETTVEELHPESRDKPWGREMLIAATPWYTAKLVYLDKEKATSRHHHVRRKETLVFLTPNCSLKIGEQEVRHPAVDEAVTIQPGQEHALTGGPAGGRIFEVSVFDPDQTDVVRTSDPWARAR